MRVNIFICSKLEFNIMRSEQFNRENSFRRLLYIIITVVRACHMLYYIHYVCVYIHAGIYTCAVSMEPNPFAFCFCPFIIIIIFFRTASRGNVRVYDKWHSVMGPQLVADDNLRG